MTAVTTAFAAVGVLMSGSVGAAALKKQPTAAHVQRLIDSKGARAARSALFDNGASEKALLEGIGAGGAGWLRIAAQLLPVSDAASAEGLVDAVQEALPKNPTGVLHMVRDGTVPAKHACGGYGFGQIEDERPKREQLRLLDIRIAAVRAVRTPRLSRVKEACLDELASLRSILAKR